MPVRHLNVLARGGKTAFRPVLVERMKRELAFCDRNVEENTRRRGTDGTRGGESRGAKERMEIGDLRRENERERESSGVAIFSGFAESRKKTATERLVPVARVLFRNIQRAGRKSARDCGVGFTCNSHSADPRRNFKCRFMR